MKTILLMLLLSGTLLLGCKNKQTENFIPGTYVSETDGKYGKASDTLTIIADGEDRYQVSRSIGVQSKRDGKLLPLKLKRTHWQGIYDPQRKEISDNAFGFVLHFSPDSGFLKLQTARFNKID
ncbi:hypothetical protein SAMN05216464_108119 [Mucilaginibacter pineti]|uniref:Lipoprotein n=1 Tax=Mucilaginibacter pineti TaxID=1391627 RepID=A0A1G7EQX5_9SPHI|nr:hypothetical protein [Mucilaginibacter pineti]SDE65836.1 hypothetical protein SAMN05216464_108119 [Mucilaginibacter pineti]